MSAMSFALILALTTVLMAEFVNGWTDAPNVIATVISSGVMSPRAAILMAVVMNTVGAMSGTAVAATVGKGIVDPAALTLPSITSAMISIIAWGTFAARAGLPVSKSHALLAGLAGAAFAGGGLQALQWAGWEKVIIGMVLSIVLGGVAAFVIGLVVVFLAGGSKPARSKKSFRSPYSGDGVLPGIQPWSQRRPEIHGRVRDDLADRRSDGDIRDSVLGHPDLRTDDGGRNFGRRVAHHQNDRLAHDEAAIVAGLCRAGRRRLHHLRRFSLRHTTLDNAHDHQRHCRRCREPAHIRCALDGTETNCACLVDHISSVLRGGVRRGPRRQQVILVETHDGIRCSAARNCG